MRAHGPALRCPPEASVPPLQPRAAASPASPYLWPFLFQLSLSSVQTRRPGNTRGPPVQGASDGTRELFRTRQKARSASV